MKYAEVSVNSPIAQRRSFTYAIPPGADISIGQAVQVPFGARTLQGIVIELTETSSIDSGEIKEISGLIDPLPVVSSERIALARWISEYYLAPLFESIALMLPAGFERKAIAYLEATDKTSDYSLSPDEQKALDFVKASGKTKLTLMEKELGKRKAQSAVSRLVKLGLLARSYALAAPRVKAKLESYVGLGVTTEKARSEAALLRGKQAALLDFLAAQPGPVSLSGARKQLKFTKATLAQLISRGLVEIRQVAVSREAVPHLAPVQPHSFALTTAQEDALSAIGKALSGAEDERVFLLHGVTGSGKTEVYLRSLAAALKEGKRGIVLVPEISLTPQTIERFTARVPGRVALLHSRLTHGEQFDEWHRIREGQADVVIGPRSALFAPQPDLGLIVIDEEHEWTYKQDTSPRYHTRAAVLKLAELTGAVVVLGSATPDVETYYRAQKGEIRLLELPQRVVPTHGAPLPPIEIVDMRQELKSGNRSIFSRPLSEATAKALAAREQVIMFLNRRGASTFVQCRDCGFSLRCKRCDVALSYHAADNVLTCHHCNYHTRVPAICPRCGSPRIKFFGLGTQKLEEEVGASFPQAGRLRWDSDTTKDTPDHEILRRFRDHEADILIGTQVVAKGLDLPCVSVVGVISADTSLNLPDFRAGERTFQLLSQVAGRAGRGAAEGRVVVQTYSPEHYAVQAAAKHDYLAFYNQEIAYRRELNYPPFTGLALLVYSHPNNAACQKEVERMKTMLAGEIESRGLSGMSFIGPAPAFVHKLRGRFRWELILRGAGLSAFLSPFRFPAGWTIDIDPVSVI